MIFDLAMLLKSKNISLSCYGGHKFQVAELQLKAQQLGVEDVLKFEPFMSPADLHGTLDNEVSIGLVPLQDTFYSRYLTCPVKALDCLSHGLPVVASELPSTYEVLQNAGAYCSSSEAAQFVKVIEELLSYAEDKDNPTTTVYGYVPTDVIVKIIEDNGGIKE